MILVAFVDVWAAPVLVLDKETIQPKADLDAELMLVDGMPWMRVTAGAKPVEIDWEASRLAPPGGGLGPFWAAERQVHGPSGPPDPWVPAGENRLFWVVPTAWVEADVVGEHMPLWSTTSFSQLDLVVRVNDQSILHRTLWRTEEAVEQPVEAPLAIPAVAIAVPRVRPSPERLKARLEWDQRYRTIRKEAQLARTVWWSSLVVGGIATGGALREVVRGVEATRSGDDAVEYRTRATILGAVGLVGLGITVPGTMWERNARKRMLGLGRRP